MNVTNIGQKRAYLGFISSGCANNSVFSLTNVIYENDAPLNSKFYSGKLNYVI
jgi:hypothetical protein